MDRYETRPSDEHECKKFSICTITYKVLLFTLILNLIIIIDFMGWVLTKYPRNLL